MTDHHASDAKWHVTHSRPSTLIDYLDPTASFSATVNLAVSRFRSVHELCTQGFNSPDMTRVRNELAFHLVKISRWWDFDFCPYAIAGIRGQIFTAYAKNHAARNLADDSLFDVITSQNFMHRGDASHIMVLGTDREQCEIGTLFYGMDGARNFRFAWRDADEHPIWSAGGYSSFIGAWIGARLMSQRISGIPSEKSEWQHIRREYNQASVWHRHHFHKYDGAFLMNAYDTVQKQYSECKSELGRDSFRHLVNGFAFKIARWAYEAECSVAFLLEHLAKQSSGGHEATLVHKRAHQHVRDNVDVLLKDQFLTMLSTLEAA